MIDLVAESLLGYLYLKRTPLSWDRRLYGIYIGLEKLTGAFSAFFIIVWLKQSRKIHDATLIIVSILSASLGEVWFGLSTQTWMVFMGKIIILLSIF